MEEGDDVSGGRSDGTGRGTGARRKWWKRGRRALGGRGGDSGKG